MEIDIDKARAECATEFGDAWERQSPPDRVRILSGWLAAKRHAAQVDETSTMIPPGLDREQKRAFIVAHAEPSGASVDSVARDAGWVSVDERLPAPSELVVVFTSWRESDWPGSVNIGLDCIDPNDDDHASWEGHNNHYEHYCCVAGGLENCTGPSAQAPYTHWHALAPTPVAAMSPTKAGEGN